MAQLFSHDDRAEGVLDINVPAMGKVKLRSSNRLSYVRTTYRPLWSDVARLPFPTHNPAVATARMQRGSTRGQRTIDTGYDQAEPHDVDAAPERRLDGFEIGIDIRMVELDISEERFSEGSVETLGPCRKMPCRTRHFDKRSRTAGHLELRPKFSAFHQQEGRLSAGYVQDPCQHCRRVVFPCVPRRQSSSSRE